MVDPNYIIGIVGAVIGFVMGNFLNYINILQIIRFIFISNSIPYPNLNKRSKLLRKHRIN